MKITKQTGYGRLIGLDIFRVLAAFVVFMFHSAMHIGCDYGKLRFFTRMGAIFMTGFYLLSGYILFYTYSKYDLQKITDITIFYKKRLIGILPLYYVCGFLFEFLLGTLSFKENILLFPIEILGIQSAFTSLSGVTHNGGTWFVSCLLICYVIYPFIQELTKQMLDKYKAFLVVILSFIIIYASVIQISYNTATIYDNPFFRLLEFTIGVLLGSMKSTVESKKGLKPMFSVGAFLIELSILVLGVTYAVLYNIHVENYMFYNIIALPIFILMIMSLSGIRFKDSKVIRYLSDISYAFFLAQFFTWPSTRFLLSIIKTESNIIKIMLSLVICLLYSVILHEFIEKPVSKMMKKPN